MCISGPENTCTCTSTPDHTSFYIWLYMCISWPRHTCPHFQTCICVSIHTGLHIISRSDPTCISWPLQSYPLLNLPAQACPHTCRWLLTGRPSSKGVSRLSHFTAWRTSLGMAFFSSSERNLTRQSRPNRPLQSLGFLCGQNSTLSAGYGG